MLVQDTYQRTAGYIRVRRNCPAGMERLLQAHRQPKKKAKVYSIPNPVSQNDMLI